MVIPTTRVFLGVTRMIRTRCVCIPIVKLSSNVVSGLCTGDLRGRVGIRWAFVLVLFMLCSFGGVQFVLVGY